MAKKGLSCCRVESVVSLDDRGQVLLPKEIRDKAGLRPGDKLAVITWEIGDEMCCISLIKTEGLEELVKGLLQPVMKQIIEK